MKNIRERNLIYDYKYEKINFMFDDYLEFIIQY